MHSRLFYKAMTRILLLLGWAALPAIGQKVRLDFPKTVFRDDFASDSGHWKELSNASNLLLLQKGEYILQRRSSGSYSAFPSYKNLSAPFSLTASVRMDDGSDPESGIGLVFMAQPSGNGGFSLELNGRREFRIRQLVGVSYRLLTGDNRNLGWTRSEALNGKGAWNTVQVRTADRNYDLYLNGQFVMTFSDPQYFGGDFGLTIGPMSSGRVDWIDVRTPEQAESSETSPIVLPVPADDPARLQEELNRLRKENIALRDSLQRCRQSKPAIRKPLNNGHQE
jgi:hypothetical protein